DVELWKMMKQVNMMYAIFFNKRYDYVGPLFQGRYRADLIKSLARKMEVSRYIHLNPVVARMVKNPLDYPWSSYPAFMGLSEDPLVSPERLLECPKEQRGLYREYVEEDL
ncbi:MAG: transposase, partial [Bacillota bacterium]|nr:transposase [Bacillota bacterium]